MQDVGLKEVFDIYQKQSDSVHKLWAYFQVVSLAVVGVAMGGQKADWVSQSYALIGLSYFVFAAASVVVIYRSQKELYRFGKAVKSAASASGPLGQQLRIKAMEPTLVAAFQVVAALVVLISLGMAWTAKPADGSHSGSKAAAAVSFTCQASGGTP